MKNSKCHAYQASDQMRCKCGLAWDVNDPEPPECKGLPDRRTGPPERRAAVAIKSYEEVAAMGVTNLPGPATTREEYERNFGPLPKPEFVERSAPFLDALAAIPRPPGNSAAMPPHLDLLGRSIRFPVELSVAQALRMEAAYISRLGATGSSVDAMRAAYRALVESLK